MDECKNCGCVFIEGLDVVTGFCPDCLERRKRELVVQIGNARYGKTPMVSIFLNGREVCRQFINGETAAALTVVESVRVEVTDE